MGHHLLFPSCKRFGLNINATRQRFLVSLGVPRLAPWTGVPAPRLPRLGLGSGLWALGWAVDVGAAMAGLRWLSHSWVPLARLLDSALCLAKVLVSRRFPKASANHGRIKPQMQPHMINARSPITKAGILHVFASLGFFYPETAHTGRSGLQYHRHCKQYHYATT